MGVATSFETISQTASTLAWSLRSNPRINGDEIMLCPGTLDQKWEPLSIK